LYISWINKKTHTHTYISPTGTGDGKPLRLCYNSPPLHPSCIQGWCVDGCKRVREFCLG